MTVFAELRRLARRWMIPAPLSDVAAAGLVACGGGTSQVQAFIPARLIVFGDEHSLVVNDGSNNGRKYSVNGLDSTLARDCLLLPLWSQSLASHYGFVFAECNKAAATPQAFMRAQLGATVDSASIGVAAQVAAQAAAGSPVQRGDLVAIMLGANDVLELSDKVQAGTLTADAAIAEARARGGRLAEIINQMLATGARAVVQRRPAPGHRRHRLRRPQLRPGAGRRHRAGHGALPHQLCAEQRGRRRVRRGLAQLHQRQRRPGGHRCHRIKLPVGR